ncbi:MAG: signal peptidase I [Lysobacterales bacterium]
MTQTTETTRQKIRRIGRENLPVLFVLLGIATFRTAVADWSHIPSSSMEPNFYPGDYIWVEKFSYGPSIPLVNKRLPGWGSPQRGDIVTFVPPHTDEVYIKRVMGVPGDEVTVSGPKVWINGQPLAQTFERLPNGNVQVVEEVDGSAHTLLFSANLGLSPVKRTFKVPSGEYFMMGDHRNNSEDSRVWGFAQEDQIQGRVTHVAVSFASERPWGQRFAQRVIP